MVTRGDFRHGLVRHDFAFTEDGDFAVGFKEERAFLAHDHSVIRAHFGGRQAEGCKGGKKRVVVVMYNKFFARKLSPSRICNRTEVESLRAKNLLYITTTTRFFPP